MEIYVNLNKCFSNLNHKALSVELKIRFSFMIYRSFVSFECWVLVSTFSLFFSLASNVVLMVLAVFLGFSHVGGVHSEVVSFESLLGSNSCGGSGSTGIISGLRVHWVSLELDSTN